MSTLPFAATTPISVARVGLRSRDASRLAAYYKSILGLEETRKAGNTIALGVGDRELLEIEESPALREDDPRSAGLFHTAFLLPAREDLARWVRMAIDEGIPIGGASDHLVSEALYLTDPEGNGIEIYVDRPRDKWNWDGDSVQMATERLDIPGLLSVLPEGDEGWKGAPGDSVIGHAHLRVGDPQTAEAWWHGEFGFDTVARYGSAAVFMSTGGYHHHIGANSWQSGGAGQREKDRTGLSFVELVSREANAETVKADPWGNEIRVVPANG